MDATKGKIRTVSTILMICSLLLCCFFLLSVLYRVASQLGVIGSIWNPARFTHWTFYAQTSFSIIVFGFLAFIFIGIRKDGTPFSLRLSKRLKILALVTFLANTIPPLMADLSQELIYTGIPILNIPVPLFPFFSMPFPILSNYLAIALILTIILYGIALVIQHGAALQVESSDIV